MSGLFIAEVKVILAAKIKKKKAKETQAMHPTERHMVLLLVLASLLVVADQQIITQIGQALKNIPVKNPDTAWHIHVVNGLSKDSLFVHCKSKDNDVGLHNLARGFEIQWSFDENVWGTTLFWCFLRKPGATASFDVFWVESRHNWLHHRCAILTCIWIAKDDGIYLRNNSDHIDELIHKWGK
ncbi:S-protein homolog 1-like [Momordica charantia]|uniref:S-protein homolog n=1 Tax=Momordica charantia TaxID=3673 RepID=A0A6J1D5G6_MOMCH|nr:S-protein homolog 1-like [Momordica charantia]